MDDNLDFLDQQEESPVEAQPESGVDDSHAPDGAEAQAPDPSQTEKETAKGLRATLEAEIRQRKQLEQQLLQSQQKQAELAKQKEEDADPYREEIEGRVMSKTEQMLLNQRLNIFEALARDKYADFDAKIEVFGQMVQQNDALYYQMIQQVNPAEFAYKTATNQQKLQEMGDPLEYEKGLRAKIEAELEAKYKVKLDEETKKRAALPGTLATASAAGGATAATWSGPMPLADILS